MILIEGQEVYVGAKVYGAGQEIPDEVAREHGFDVDAINSAYAEKVKAEAKAKESAPESSAPAPTKAPKAQPNPGSEA